MSLPCRSRRDCSLRRALAFAAGALVLAGPVRAEAPPGGDRSERERVTLAELDAEPVSMAEPTLAAGPLRPVGPDFLALPVRGGTGAQWRFAGGDSAGWRWQFGGFALDRRDGRFDLDGSSLSVPVGPGRAYVSVQRRHWGPSRIGSLILDGGARAVPAIGWRKTSAAPSGLPALSWLGPWRADVFAGQLSNSTGPGQVKLLGARLEVEPLDGLEIGASRVMQWGGAGRSESLPSLLRGIAGADNFGSGSSFEPGNQLGGFDLRYTLRLDERQAIALHGQAIGEDEAHQLPSRYLGSLGADLSAALDGGAALNLFVEAANTTAGGAFGRPEPGTAYQHPLYAAGYVQRDVPLGHPAGGDVRLLTAGLELARGPLRVLLMAHGGSALSPTPTLRVAGSVRGLDADLQVLLPQGFRLGLALTYWRDALGRRSAAQLRWQVPLERLVPTPAARSAWRAGSS